MGSGFQLAAGLLAGAPRGSAPARKGRPAANFQRRLNIPEHGRWPFQDGLFRIESMLPFKQPRMKQPTSKPMPFLSAVLAAATLAALPARADLLEKSKTVGGATVHYKVILPNAYDPAKAYPAILAFGGGPQTMNTVDSVLNRNFRAEAEKRGYIVIAPAAPDGQLFFEDGSRIFPVFLKMILADYKIQ